jgi:hypothetical protein
MTPRNDVKHLAWKNNLRSQRIGTDRSATAETTVTLILPERPGFGVLVSYRI